jgi:hypothetical protein
VHAINRKKKKERFTNGGMTHITRTFTFNIITWSISVRLLKTLLKFESTGIFLGERFHKDAVKVTGGGASTLAHLRQKIQCGRGDDAQQCRIWA